MQTRNLPIGVFDSGMGGLTVLRQLIVDLPQESFVYLGDTARLPYGTKSCDTVVRYATQMATSLLAYRIKLLVVACNTASASALPYLRQQFPDLPIIGVIEPGARMAVAVSRHRRIAILATETTIGSGVYQDTIYRLAPEAYVVSQTCGLFVALAEEGSVDDEVAYVTARKYLVPLLQPAHRCDCVVLGCTHFPVLKQVIGDVLGKAVTIVDSAVATAKEVAAILQQQDLLHQQSSSPPAPVVTFLTTDMPERFIRLGHLFFGGPIAADAVHLVDGQGSASGQCDTVKWQHRQQ